MFKLKRSSFILIIALILSGCQKQMTNDEIIKETKKCVDNGLCPKYFYQNVLSMKPVEIICVYECDCEKCLN